METFFLYSANIPSKRSLSAEINLYASLRDVHSNAYDLAGTLANLGGQDQKIEVAWANQLSNIILSPVNDELQNIQALGTFADDLERRCGLHAPPAR